SSVRFDDRNRLIKGKAGHGMRGVFPDSGKLSHSLDFPREISAKSINKRFCCGMKIPGTSVITEALPRAKHLVFRSARQRSEIRKPAQPLVIIRDDGGDLRLLEHELGHKDRVRIASPAPGKIATMSVIPSKKRATKNGKVLWRCHGLEANVQRSTSNPEFRVEHWALSVERSAFSEMNSYTHPLTYEQVRKLRALLEESGFEFAPKEWTIFFAQKNKLSVAVYEKGPKVLV